MGRIATRIEEQIEILKKRGMELDYSHGKTKEILYDIGYYRLGFYWNPFEVDEDHNFESGTKFSTAVKLYYLDVDLRNLLVRYINRIEINFRTNVIYLVSNKYKSSPTWFIDPDVVEQEYIDNIDKHYNDRFKNDNKPIKLHHKKYLNDKYAPAWKTLEFFTFGAILKIYSSLKDEEMQKRIAGKYGVINIKKFKNLINTMVFVRNACAHGNVIFDLKTPKGISSLPALNFHNGDRHSLRSAVLVILYFLDQISQNRKKELEQEFDNLIEKNCEDPVLKKIIETKMGCVLEKN